MASLAGSSLLAKADLSNVSVLLALTAAICFGLVASHVIHNIFLHPLRNYPGPFLWRLSTIPSDSHLYFGTHHAKLIEHHLKYGPTIRVGPNELSVANSTGIRDVLAHKAGKEEFPKDVSRITLAPNGIASILMANKENHGRYRRLLAHAFSEKGLREQEPRIRSYVDLMIERMREKAKTGEATDICDWYTMTVFDVIGDLAWGTSFDSLRDRNVHEWIPAILGNVQFGFQSGVLQRWGLQRLQAYFVKKEVLAKRTKNYMLAKVKVDQRAEYKEPRGDFWDRVLIKSGDDNATGEGMSKGEMLVNASVIVLGGAETSATTLSGATIFLLQHPDALEKALHEVRSAFSSAEEIDVYSVAQLAYLDAVLNETMRLYAPVPSQNARISPVGGGTVNGNFIPQGVTINIPQSAAGRMPSNYHRANDFLPERWLENAPSEFKNDDRDVLLPFSLGTRNCIGRNLAYAEMRLIFAKVLYHFDMQLDSRRTGDWFDQKSYGVWSKPPQYVKLALANA